jgi:hypothetical protein
LVVDRVEANLQSETIALLITPSHGKNDGRKKNAHFHIHKVAVAQDRTGDLQIFSLTLSHLSYNG